MGRRNQLVVFFKFGLAHACIALDAQRSDDFAKATWIRRSPAVPSERVGQQRNFRQRRPEAPHSLYAFSAREISRKQSC